MADPFFQFVKNLKTFGLEYFQRYYSVYPGVVEETNDPTDQGRVKVSVPDLAREKGNPFTLHAYPITPFAGKDYGFFFPPVIGDRVWVMFDGGELSQPLYFGGWWLSPDKNSESSYLPEEAKDDGDPTLRILKTVSGHALIFEDDPSKAKRVELRTAKRPNEDSEELHRLILSDEQANERIEIRTFEGHVIEMIDIAGEHKIRLKTKGNHEILMDDQNRKIAVTSTDGHKVEINDPAKTIELLSADGLSIKLNDTTETTSLDGQIKQETFAQNVTRSIEGDEQNTTQGNKTEVVQGNYTETVEGNETRTVQGNKTETVQSNAQSNVIGNETHDVQGNWTNTVLGTFSLIVDALAQFVMTTTSVLIGIPPTTISFSPASMILTAATIQLVGAVNVTGSMTISGAVINLVPGTPVPLGQPAGQRFLLTEDAIQIIENSISDAASDTFTPLSISPGSGLTQEVTAS